MSDNNNDKINYTGEDIKRYLNGQMSATEMHDLESHALEDPFLADAIEGYEVPSQTPNEIHEDLDDLRLRLKTRLESPRKNSAVPLFKTSWLRIAAAVLLTAGIGTLVYYATTITQADKALVAKNKEPVTVNADSSPSAASAPVTSPDTTALALHQPEAKKLSTVPYRKEESVVRSAAPLLPSQKADAPLKDAVALSLEKEAPKINDSVQRNSSLAKMKVADKKLNIDDPIADLGYGTQKKRSTFSGRVLSEDNQPLPGTFVSATAANKELKLKTDTNGYFKFSAPDSTASVVVNKPGFETVSREIAGDSKVVDIRINSMNKKAESAPVALSEVLAGRVAGVDFTTPKPETAEPLVGFPAYDRYLLTNKKSRSDSTIHGNVIISFVVREDGAISDYKIEKSLSKQTDNEAIRLVKEGPGWKVLTKKRELVTLTIKF